MRYIFVDEAGTSANEPVTVVVGIIASADQHVMAAERRIEEILGGVPAAFKEGFVFSAKTILQDQRYQSEWTSNDRLGLVKAMMAVPRRIGMTISVAVYWRGAQMAKLYDEFREAGMSVAQADHFMAFNMCLACADGYIRDAADHSEVASVVAEDTDEMRKHLKHVVRMLRASPHVLKPEHQRRTVWDEEAGHPVQRGEIRVTRIRSSIHFVAKAEDPLVQVADACAYGIRRYFAEQPLGLEFANEIVGDHKLLSVFGRPGGCQCY